MRTKEIVEKVRRLALPVAEAQGVSLWDVEFEKEGGAFMLTVFIDSEEGVSIDRCEAVSRALDPILDKEDFIDAAYTLCVSSAGLTRTLKRPEHFAYALGKKVEARFFTPVNGKKSVTGVLSSYENGRIGLADGGEAYETELTNVALCRLHFEF